MISYRLLRALYVEINSALMAALALRVGEMHRSAWVLLVPATPLLIGLALMFAPLTNQETP